MRSVIMSLLAALALTGCGAAASTAAQPTAQAVPTTQPAPTAQPTATVPGPVTGAGVIVAAREANLSFAVSGTVGAVLVKAGDVVTSGQVLARLDARRFEAQVRRAEVGLQSAQAQEAGLTAAPRAAALAAARAQVRQAQIALAQARSEQTQDGRTADSSVSAAQAALQSARDQLSAAKTSAQLGLQTTTASLTQAQADYASAKGNWEYVQEQGRDPITPTVQDAQGRLIPNKLNEAQRQQYYDAFVKAEAALRQAETGVRQAQLSYDAARQAEVSGVQQSEQQLAQAQIGRDRQQLPEDVDRTAAAQAQLDAARAALAQLTPDPTASERAIAAAAVAAAEVDLTQARLDLASAALTAPFAGVVGGVKLTVGESAPGAEAALRLVDLSALKAEVQVSSLDIQRVSVGQRATVQLDGAGGAVSGRVSAIGATANTDSGRRSFLVTVALDDPAGLRPGMSARVTFAE